MNPIPVLLPEDSFINTVLRIRQEIVAKKLGGPDPREKVLPHSTILYVEEDLTPEKINLIIQGLNTLKLDKSVSSTIKEYAYWQPKVTVLLDLEPLKDIKKKLKNSSKE